jgi:hypothetical protein
MRATSEQFKVRTSVPKIAATNNLLSCGRYDLLAEVSALRVGAIRLQLGCEIVRPACSCIQVSAGMERVCLAHVAKELPHLRGKRLKAAEMIFGELSAQVWRRLNRSTPQALGPL